jgi:CBS domain-containing protein
MAKSRALMESHIRNVMSPRLITISPDASLVDVARELAAHDIGAVPVVEKDELVGIVTTSDLVHLLHDRTRLDSKVARDIMSPHPIGTDEFATVDEAIGIMRNASIRHLPVTREGRLVGIVTHADLIRHLVQDFPAPEVA